MTGMAADRVLRRLSRALPMAVAATHGLASVTALHAAPPIHKCVIEGRTTYQSDPCPTSQPRRTPTLRELNARQRERAAAADAVRTNRPVSNPSGADLPAPADRSPAPFRCDGRVYCSQMTSCAEAKYFLANCPGVKMDGDRDGTPCETQWCSP